MSAAGAVGIVAALCGLLAAAGTAAQPVDLHGLTQLPEPRERVLQVGKDTLAGFDRVLAQYTELKKQRPYDVFVWLDECTFIDDFTAQFEDSDSVAPAYEQSERCEGDLVARFAEHPEVQLRHLERLYDDAEILKQGRALLPRLNGASWTTLQTSRVYTLLANAAERARDKSSIEWARLALRFDDRADVRIPLARQLLASGDKRGAADALASFVDDHDPGDYLYLTAKMRALYEAGLRAEALAVYSALSEARYFDHSAVAKLLLRMGDVEHARTEFEKAARGLALPANRREQFLLELEHGSAAQAAAAYNAWRDLGWAQDPVGLSRWSLFLRAPQLPWAWRDLLGAVGFLGVLVASAFIALLPISAVHYRGLVRRARLGEAYPTQGWSLTEAWRALLAFTTAEVIGYYAVGPVELSAGGPAASATSAEHWSNLLIVHSFAVLLLLWPTGRAAAVRQPIWWGRDWTLGKSLLVGAGIATALRLPLLLALLVAPSAVSRALLDLDLGRLVAETSRDYGVLAAVWGLAIAAPVLEEIVFRGVLLGAFRQHLSPWWANVAQATLFAAMHADLRATIPLFIVGLILGTLARRSGGLLAPMVMHGVFNGLAGLALFRT